MRSQRAANQPHTLMKLYVRSILCFSPDRTPGVSTRVTSSSSLLAQLAASNLARKPFPYCARPCSSTREVGSWFQNTAGSLDLNCCGILQLMLAGNTQAEVLCQQSNLFCKSICCRSSVLPACMKYAEAHAQCTQQRGRMYFATQNRARMQRRNWDLTKAWQVHTVRALAVGICTNQKARNVTCVVVPAKVGLAVQ